MTDQELVADPLADEVNDVDDLAETDEDDAPETYEGDEVEYDLSVSGGA